ncbi:E3 ubiquitin-protein ligase HECTD3-like isoform X2 [Protopterus annectens]|uniref:E3 ubiquitin-protein ligase HECTD3-like isoform X2 n=1 Tax=Protopterus annectens TaxID=7888 RepID=UPI001CF96B7A|nr:E3 ubiquitin-protein ligase HECTD3-like isoform X2 [Protopterus annectens]
MTMEQSPHLLLGRVRFVLECIQCFRETKPLPEFLCYVPKDVYYKICRDSPSVIYTGKNYIPVWESPRLSKKISKFIKFKIELKKGACIRATGEEYLNSYGLWVKMNKEQMEEYNSGCQLEEGWIVLGRNADGLNKLQPLESLDRIQNEQLLYGYGHKPVTRWEQVVDAKYSHYAGRNIKIAEMDEVAVERFRYIPPNWTYECDEDLIHYLHERTSENLSNVSQYLEKIEVSSDVGETFARLTDGLSETYWQSNSGEKPHWIRLHMKKDIIIKKLILLMDEMDSSFLPKKINVYGKQSNDLKILNEIDIDNYSSGEACVLECMNTFMPTIEIHILECEGGGMDTRIRGLKIIPQTLNVGMGVDLNVDMFQSSNLIRYPRLAGVEPDVLYRRAIVILRFSKVLDNLITHLIPAWKFSVGIFLQLKYIRQFFLLTKQRSALITQLLKSTESEVTVTIPKLVINRKLAMKHRENPSFDPSYKNSIFSQMYFGLKYSKEIQKPLNYRWPASHTQWWHCIFVLEGMMDHGGGFRESLSDISEELCPSQMGGPLPLPFFVRTSNQGNDIGESRDAYVPNPSCKDFAKYEWIGQLMGAAFRGNEFLVMAFPPLVWKLLAGEAVIWNKDFLAVDSMLVKLLEALEEIDEEAFEFQFGNELTYTTMLSDQRVVDLIPGGSHIPVKYEDRKEFIQLAQRARLQESRKQISAMKAGLVKVVPHAALSLLTWQEIEKKICGDPEIAIEDLKKSEERSRFLRFVTGRSRLSTSIIIGAGRLTNNETSPDVFPETSTCSRTLYLPDYPSAQVCEEKLRYAIYNCLSIDGDGIVHADD